MISTRWAVAVFFALACVASISVYDAPVDIASGTKRADPSRLLSEPIVPIQHVSVTDPARALLGKRLFEDPRLSGDGTVACASCHPLDKAGVDRQRVSTGIGGARGERNAPTVFNAALLFRLFWDGRARTLEEQVNGPITNPGEMGADWPGVVQRVAADPSYNQAFAAIYGGPPTADHIRDAIATFERTLLTPDSRFDRWLRGDDSAINATELRGYELFKTYGCVSCHQGRAVGGNIFQRFGVHEPASPTETDDVGRMKTTGDPADKYVFRVPSLRNVAVTAPYFHDGRAATLAEAVQTMARVQLGRTLPAADARAIVAFLRTLTGRYEGSELR